MKMILPSPQGRNLNKRPGVYSMYRRLFESGVYLSPAFIWNWTSLILVEIIFGNLEKGLWTTAVLQLQFISFMTAKGSSRNVYFTLS